MFRLREKRISFREKVIWITGASSGIGEALAVRLSAMGARLILTSRNAEALAKVKGRCVGDVVILPADLAGGRSFTFMESQGPDPEGKKTGNDLPSGAFGGPVPSTAAGNEGDTNGLTTDAEAFEEPPSKPHAAELSAQFEGNLPGYPVRSTHPAQAGANSSQQQTDDGNSAPSGPPAPSFHTRLVNEAIGIYGRVDILISNAGIGQRATAEETSETVLRQILELDFFSPVLLTQALLPHFRSHGGQVVVTGSMAGLMGVPRRTAYSAAKHAVMGYFESLQVEHNIPGFYVTIVSPGRVKTSLSFNALHGNGAPHGKMDAAQEKGIPADECARKMIGAIALKRKHVIIAREERLLWWLRKFVPPLYYVVARKYGSRS